MEEKNGPGAGLEISQGVEIDPEVQIDRWLVVSSSNQVYFGKLAGEAPDKLLTKVLEKVQAHKPLVLHPVGQLHLAQIPRPDPTNRGVAVQSLPHMSAVHGITFTASLHVIPDLFYFVKDMVGTEKESYERLAKAIIAEVKNLRMKSAGLIAPVKATTGG